MEKVVEVDRVRGKGLGQQEPLPLKEPAAPGLLRTRPSSEQRCWSGPFSRPRFPERLSQSSVCVCAGGGFPLTRSCLRSAGAGGKFHHPGKAEGSSWKETLRSLVLPSSRFSWSQPYCEGTEVVWGPDLCSPLLRSVFLQD